MILLVDAGNTRIKWGVHDGARWVVQGSVPSRQAWGLATAWSELRPIAAWVSSVAGADTDTSLRDMFGKLGITTRWLHASGSACGVINGYDQPERLGSDRWAALLAAWHLKHAPCVVATAGTALTVDALSARGEFLGGLIVPGLAMMKAALGENTAGVTQRDGRWQDFPTTTGDAVHSGVLAAMAGAVRHMMSVLEKREGVMPALVISGGDAVVLRASMAGLGEIVDNLVLEGLLLLARESIG
ncbi:MAG: type III pantothenate kinase [Methylophilaceae bacterium]|nr:type III pantothenate kinase [Methylophilaceae bacterium]